jgi:predicted transcriptional regulator
MVTNRKAIVVRERQIEDILATYTDLLGQILGAPAPLRVLARQLELPNGGRLDLLCLGGGQLHLIEIKVEPARKEFVQQTACYLAQIPLLQQQGALPTGKVRGYLLSPYIPPHTLHECQIHQIHAIQYAPSSVLQHFYNEFQQRLSFNRLITRNHGVWHLGVTNPIIQSLANASLQGVHAIAKQTRLALSTVKSYLTLLMQLGLVLCDGTLYRLTDLGKRYAQAMEPHSRSLSEGQAEVLRDFILRNPFASGVTLGIFTVVECTASLAKNQYPVPLTWLSDYFTLAVGNETRWNQPKTRHDATRMYVEYAAQLGLLARVGDRVYLTPTGARFNLLLQMHKSIHLVVPLTHE